MKRDPRGCGPLAFMLILLVLYGAVALTWVTGFDLPWR